MPPPPFAFRRPALAKQLSDALMGATPFSYRSGLFLAAPRRTGKSTFLRDDLVPELHARDVTTAYVDLWSDRARDPGELISQAVKAALRASEPGAIRFVRGMGLQKFGLGGVSFDLDRVGTSGGATLTDAMTSLVEKTGKPMALIVDEAQHALNTEGGVNAMFALKAARDALNQTESDGPRLMLVFTGSHRDKLANLVLRRDQPFFGSSVMDFPLLNRAYTDAYTAWLNERLAVGNTFDPDDVFKAFDILGRRPEMLEETLKAAAFSVESAASLKSTLAEDAAALRERLWEDYDRDHSTLSPLQQAVLARLIREGERFAPFAGESLAAYSAAVGENVEANGVQSAIAALRERNIIWRSARGTYTLEDQGMSDWFFARYPQALKDNPGPTSPVVTREAARIAAAVRTLARWATDGEPESDLGAFVATRFEGLPDDELALIATAIADALASLSPANAGTWGVPADVADRFATARDTGASSGAS